MDKANKHEDTLVDAKYEKSAIMKMSIVGVFGNVVLVVFKFVAGIVGNSAAMVTDAIHSLSDVFATFVAFSGATLGRKEADKKHPYGHERFESIAALILAEILFAAAVWIFVDGSESIIFGTFQDSEAPTTIAIVAAIVSIITKEAMFWYTMHYAKKLNSSAFKADAWHHRSDAISSIGALIGIVGSLLGCKILDPIACLFIGVLILKVSIDVFRDGLSKLTDKTCGEEFESKIVNIVRALPGVNGVDNIKTRKFGDKQYVDIEICVDGNLKLYEAHEIAENVHDVVENKHPNVKHIMVHVNPVNYIARVNNF